MYWKTIRYHKMVTEKLCPQNVCTGCYACKQVCAKGAIHSKEDKGFSYPEIDASQCVDCGLCTKVCPVLNPDQCNDVNKDNAVSYAIWNNNLRDRMNSSSGGAFSALADKVIKEGGIVYGAAWDNAMRLKHIGVDDINGLESLRRSKYVQSSTDGVFKDVKQKLKLGRQVLFSGTPCQIAGLLSYLGKKDYPNLITVGVVCHGVPSQWSFDKYLREVEEGKNVRVFDCNFRSKNRGWRTDLNTVITAKNTDDKEVIIDQTLSKNVYMNAFLKQYFLRESCYNCPFKEEGTGNCADIMLSDAWSLWSTIPWGQVDFSKGVSAVVANTEKGRTCLRECAESITVIERPYSEYASNSGLKNARKPGNNDAAFEYLQTHSWMETQAHFFPLTLRQRIPLIARLIIGEQKSIRFKKIIKQMIHR